MIIGMVFLDQISKYIIINHIELGQKITLINNFFNLTYCKNYGAGFSILQNQTIFFYFIGVVAITLFTYMLVKDKSNNLSKAAYLMLISGTIGNLIDRVSHVYVVDFLDFIIFGYDFPVFNIADSFLTVGAFILIFSIMKEEKHAKN